MIMQVALTLGLLLVLLYIVVQSHRSRFLSWIAPPVLGFGLVLVWNLDLADEIARYVGVTTGADLVTYCWIVLSLLVVVNLHLRFHREEEAITELARAVALLHPELPAEPDGSSEPAADAD